MFSDRKEVGKRWKEVICQAAEAKKALARWGAWIELQRVAPCRTAYRGGSTSSSSVKQLRGKAEKRRQAAEETKREASKERI